MRIHELPTPLTLILKYPKEVNLQFKWSFETKYPSNGGQGNDKPNPKKIVINEEGHDIFYNKNVYFAISSMEECKIEIIPKFKNRNVIELQRPSTAENKNVSSKLEYERRHPQYSPKKRLHREIDNYVYSNSSIQLKQEIEQIRIKRMRNLDKNYIGISLFLTFRL